MSLSNSSDSPVAMFAGRDYDGEEENQAATTPKTPRLAGILKSNYSFSDYAATNKSSSSSLFQQYSSYHDSVTGDNQTTTKVTKFQSYHSSSSSFESSAALLHRTGCATNAVEITPLVKLARLALLRGLSDGHTTRFTIASSFCSNSDDYESTHENDLSLESGKDHHAATMDKNDPTHHPHWCSYPLTISNATSFSSSYNILHDDQFWSDLLKEAQERKCLSDIFLTSLCKSGIPPPCLQLNAHDVAVSDHFLARKKLTSSSSSLPSLLSSSASAAATTAAAEMILSHVNHVSITGRHCAAGASSGRLLSSFATSRGDNRNNSGGGFQQSSSIDRFTGQCDLGTFLHNLARCSSSTVSDATSSTENNHHFPHQQPHHHYHHHRHQQHHSSGLQSLTLGPGLRRAEERDNGSWLRALKAITLRCAHLKCLKLQGLVLSTEEEGGIGIGGGGRRGRRGGGGGNSSEYNTGGDYFGNAHNNTNGSQDYDCGGAVTLNISLTNVFETMAKNCRSLEELSLRRCIGVKDRHGQSLLLDLVTDHYNHHHNQDNEIDANGNTSYTSSSSFPNLTALDMGYTNIGALTFSALCGRSNNKYKRKRRKKKYDGDGGGIRSLNLDGTALDTSWLQRILDSMGEELEDFSIRQCSKLCVGSDLWDTLLNAVIKSSPPSSCSKSDGSDGEDFACFSNLRFFALGLTFSQSQLIQQTQHQLAQNDKVAVYSNETNNHGRETESGTMTTLTHSGNDDPDFLHFELGFGEGWACRHCTLINDDQAIRCAACNGRRYRASPPPVKNRKSPNRTTRDGVGGRVDNHDVSLLNDDKPTSRKNLQSLFEFRPIPFPSLEKMILDLNVVNDNVIDDGDYHYTTTEAAASTVLLEKVIDQLPNSLSNLSIVFPNNRQAANDNYLDRRNGNTAASSNDSVSVSLYAISSLIHRCGTNITCLELSPVRFETKHDFKTLIQGLVHVRSLHIHGNGHLGIGISDMLNIISIKENDSQLAKYGNNDGRSPYLEVLKLCVHGGAITPTPPPPYSSLNDRKQSGESVDDEVTLCSYSLKRLWIEGCAFTKKIVIKAPSLERLTVEACFSLEGVEFDFLGSVHDFPLEHLTLRNNPLLVPNSISSLRLPHLLSVDMGGLQSVEDWEFGRFLKNSLRGLYSLQLSQCRSLGNPMSWFGDNNCPLNVLRLHRPSSAFDVSSLQYLLEGTRYNSPEATYLNEISVDAAPGLKGILCAAADGVYSNAYTIDQIGSGGTLDQNTRHQRSSAHLFPRIGTGAVNDDGFLGAREIEQMLRDFVRNVQNSIDGNIGNEYGFPPTLNSYQRKLVHQSAESMGLGHESVRINTGVKIVRVRYFPNQTENDVATGVPGIGIVAPQQNGYSQEADYSLLSPRGGVAFSLDSDRGDRDLTGGSLNFVDNDDGIFEIEDIETMVGDNEITASNLQANVHHSQPHTAMSRKDIRKLKKSSRQALNETTKAADSDEELNEGISGDEEHAFDPALQCEVPGRCDKKTLRRLRSAARQLPISSDTGQPICIRYLRGVCPYQNSTRSGGGCRYAHFEAKASQLKKCSALIDFVCGRVENLGAFGRNSKFNQKKRSTEKNNQAAYSNGSHGEDGGFLMDSFARQRGNRRSRSFGNEEEELLSRSFGSDRAASDESYSSRGSSLGRHARESEQNGILSSSPIDAGDRFEFRPQINPQPLNLQRLLSLELMNCDITRAYIVGPMLSRISLKGCSVLNLLHLEASSLTVLDTRDCEELSNLPLIEGSLCGLRIADFTGCKKLDAAFMRKFADHCRTLRQLHIFGSGASERASNSKSRQKIKTKAGIAKLTASRPELELITTKKEWRALNIQAQKERNRDHDGIEMVSSGIGSFFSE